MDKFEFFDNGSYTYNVMGDVVMYHVTVRELDSNGDLIERHSASMVDTDMTVEDFQKMDLVRHIDGKIPVDFFPAEVWEDSLEEGETLREMEEDEVTDDMTPIFEIFGDVVGTISGTFDELIDTYQNMYRQWRWGLRATCPQMVLVDVQSEDWDEVGII